MRISKRRLFGFLNGLLQTEGVYTKERIVYTLERQTVIELHKDDIAACS